MVQPILAWWKQLAWPSLLLVGPTIVAAITQLITKVSLLAPLSMELANSFLATVAQVLAGILAIVFSVSVLAIGIAADRYTPRLFSYFARNRATLLTFFSLLGCILLAVVSIGVQAIPMYQWGFLAMAWLFAFCLLTLPYYFYQTLQLLDPTRLAARIKGDYRLAFKKQDRQKISGAITSLGDVAIKALERGEDEITQKYLDTLQDIQQALIAPGSNLIPPGNQRDVMSAFFGFGVRSPVSDQYYRVFKLAIAKKSEEITLHIASLLADTIVTLVEQNDGIELLKGTLQQYQDFLKIAVENGDASRFPLVHSLKAVIFPQFYTEAFGDRYLPLCRGALVHANRVIIDHDDFELWKEELTYFNTVSVDEAYDSLYDELNELLLSRALEHARWNYWNRMIWPLSTRITPTNKCVFELGLSEIKQLTRASKPELWEQVQRLRESLHKLWAATNVYDAFFTICVHALFRKRFEYIKELWRHVNPPDASVHYVNSNLVRLNLGFLTYQMTEHLSIPWSIEGHHGAEPYILEYYLLCMAYTLQQTNTDWHPTVPFFIKPLLSQDNNYSTTMGEELCAVYRFLVGLPYYAKKALAQYDTIASTSEKWDDVFNGQASAAFLKAREWLQDAKRSQEWKEGAESLIKDLPLDNSQVEAYRKAALEYYRSRSQVSQLAMIKGSAEVSAEPRSICHIQHHDKQNLTLLDRRKPQHVGTMVGFGAIEGVVQEEITHIADTMLEGSGTKPVLVKQLTFEEIVTAVKKIGSAGYRATVLLAPSHQIDFARQNDLGFRRRIEYEGGKEYLNLDESVKLRIIELCGGNYVLILDGSAGNWASVEPLEIEVAECDNQLLSVHIAAREIVSYQVLSPRAIEILKVRPSRNRRKLGA